MSENIDITVVQHEGQITLSLEAAEERLEFQLTRDRAFGLDTTQTEKDLAMVRQRIAGRDAKA